MKPCLLLALALTLIAPSLALAQPPPTLVADLASAGPAEHLLAVTIQGIANRHPDGPRVFLLTNPGDADWLALCLRLSPREVRQVTVYQLLETLKPEIAGQILYDPDRPFTLDVATTAAGLRNAVISPTDLGLPTVLDLRTRWRSPAEAHRWALENLLPECHPSKLALLPPDALAPRDFAIQNRLFTIAPPPSPQDPVIGDLLFRISPGAAVYGVAPPSLLPALSGASHYLVPTSYSANLSFLSRLDADELFYQYRGYLEPTAPRYLTFIFDCSDLDFAINEMPALWDDPTRGTLPLGWALPASLAEVAPPVLHRYYADAYRSGMDRFILGPNGAGEIDLASAPAPYSFLRTTSELRRVLDTAASYYRSPASLDDIGPAATRFAAETGVRGIFLLDAPGLPPLLFQGLPVLPAPRVDSVAAAITYLNRIPLDQRCVALTLDPTYLSPAEAAHIAAHVSDRYVIAPPDEIIELMRALSQPEQPGPLAARVTSITYPDPAPADAALPIEVHLDAPDALLSASLVYRPTTHSLSFAEPLALTADGAYAAQLPPLLCGGDIIVHLRAKDRAGRAGWLGHWTLKVPRTDADADGLADAEERFLLTDPSSPDTDADGLPDGADPSPIRPDRVSITYLGPVYAPSDRPYLPDPGDSTADPGGRYLEPGQSCLYWLPTHRLPPAATAVIALDAFGPAALAAGPAPDSLTPEFTGSLAGLWHSAPLTPESHSGGAFLRVTCPADAQHLLLLRTLALVSPPDAPSITFLSYLPAHPGPEQPITISALAFSPNGIAQTRLSYRINQGGTISLPMQPIGASQYYQAPVPALDNRDELEYWVTAADSLGNRATTTPAHLVIGGRGRETATLLARRDFYGDWISAPEWDGAARLALEPGLRDSARVNLTGGTYTVWILAAPRGQGISLYLRDSLVGSLDPNLPDGWRRVGRIRLDAGRHQVHLVSDLGPDAPPGAAPRYASVIFTADSSFDPPADCVLDLYNAIALLHPGPGATLTGRVELRATGSGNLTSADFSLDGQLLRRASGPPFHCSLSTASFPNGPHTLRVEAVDRAGPSGLAVEIPVVIAN